MAIGYNSFFLHSGGQLLVHSVLLHGGAVSGQIKGKQIIVDWIKSAQEEAQANLTIAQSRAKYQMERSTQDKILKIGDSVFLYCEIQ